MYLATIENPNIIGNGCNFNPYGFYLGGKRAYLGLPNNPEYEMGAWAGSGCDTLTVLTPNPSPKERGVTAVPNPARDKLTVQLPSEPDKTEAILTDVTGKTVLRQRLKNKQTKIDVSKLATGFYLLKITDKENTSVIKIIKE